MKNFDKKLQHHWNFWGHLLNRHHQKFWNSLFQIESIRLKITSRSCVFEYGTWTASSGRPVVNLGRNWECILIDFAKWECNIVIFAMHIIEFPTKMNIHQLDSKIKSELGCWRLQIVWKPLSHLPKTIVFVVSQVIFDTIITTVGSIWFSWCPV